MKPSIFKVILFSLLLLGPWSLKAQDKQKKDKPDKWERKEQRREYRYEYDDEESDDDHVRRHVRIYKIPDIPEQTIIIPEIHIPEIKIPDVTVPDIIIPDMEVPDIIIPDVEENDSNHSLLYLPDLAMVFPNRRPCEPYQPDSAVRDGKVEQKKTASASYKLNNNSSIVVSNKFGNVDVTTWNKDEVSFEVEIIVHAATEEKAKEILDKINVSFAEEKSANRIDALTSFANNCINIKGTADFQINYKVSIPKDANLSIGNSFGNITVPDYTGKLSLDNSYGNITAGALTNNGNAVKLSFGGGKIASYDQGKLDVRYSDVSIGQAGTISMTDNFSKVTIKSAKAITLDSRYGDLKLGTIGSMAGSSQFSKVQMETLGNALEMGVDYCPNFKIAHISKDFDKIKLSGGFSTYNLYFDENAGFNFDVNLHSGDLDVLKGLVRYDVNRSESMDNTYKGSFGNGNKANVNINARYSKVRFAVSQ